MNDEDFYLQRIGQMAAASAKAARDYTARIEELTAEINRLRSEATPIAHAEPEQDRDE